MHSNLRNLTCAIAAAVVLLPAAPRAEDPLTAARGLYAAAAYDEALALLGTIGDADVAADQRDSLDLYRALCFLALGRADDAQRSIEAIVVRDPRFRLTADDVPPRLRAAFSDVRRRVLPTVLQQKYTEAKATFEHKEFAVAAAAFKTILDGLDDADIAAQATQPPLSDLRTLVTGFHALSVAAIPPPPPPPAPVAVAEPRKDVYSAGDAAVTPPLAIRQDVPILQGRLITARAGVVEVLVNEMGIVESAVIVVSADPVLDRQLLMAVKQWKYKPALLNGVPVKYSRRVQITFRPPTP